MTYEEPPRWLPPSWEEQAPSEPPPPPKPPEVPVWAPFVALLAAFFVISIFAVTLGGIVAAMDPDVDLKNDMPIGVMFGALVAQYAAFTAAAVITVRLALGRVRRSDFGLRRVQNVWRAIGLAAAVFVGYWLVQLIVSLIQKPDEQGLVSDVKAEDSVLVLVFYFVTICLLAPFFEELFFRGFMYTVLWKRLGPVIAALIVGSLFGVVHAGDAPWLAVIALGAFGVGLCLLYWGTKSIVPSMALHALNNSLTFAVVRDLDAPLFVGVVVLSVGVVAAAGTALSERASVTA